MLRSALAVASLALFFAADVVAADAANAADGRRGGRVRVVGHSLVDDGGPFLGLGASYFTALWRCKHDRPRLEADLEFLSRQGFNSFRMLSMVGYYPAWESREIAPVSFTTRDGRRIEAWPDYWRRFGELIDLAYDDYNLRTQITVFADAQLIPKKGDRVEHLRKLLAEVVPGREHKILLIEVANEAWQNGFPGDEGLADLREFARYLGERTEIPIAITSNHDGPGADGLDAFERVYNGGVADLASWHFSRDRRTDDGWRPVYDCWDFGERPGLPPVVSNEPIGPGSSVNAEKEPVRLVVAAAFAYAAKLPAYVFHSEAGVFGKTRFQETPGIDRFGHVLRLLPNDLPDWDRNDSKQPEAPFTVYAGGEADRYRPEVESARDGCVRCVGARRGDRFVCVPIGIGPDGLTLQARHAVGFTAYDPLSGEAVTTATLAAGELITLPPGPGALLLISSVPHSDEHVRPAVGARGEVGCGADARCVKRLSITEPGLYENILVDGEWGDSTLVKILADDVTLRRCEIRNATHNGVTILGKNVTIESCKIHHLLAGTFQEQKDAHGITGCPKGLVVRDCDVAFTSGDAIQFDPSRGVWDDVLIENCTLWTAPLPEDAAGFKQGERPGENAIDTKQQASNPRSRLTVRACLLHGWNQPGQIGNIAALNLKNHVEVHVDRCVFRNNEICLRVRGGAGEYGGALVTIEDCAAYDSAIALRAEDSIRNLKVRRFGVGTGVRKFLVEAGGGLGPGYEKAGEFEPPSPKAAVESGFWTR